MKIPPGAPCKRKALTDSERIDVMERALNDKPFVLHNLETLQGPYRGLGMLGGRRTLREAIDAFASAYPPSVVEDRNDSVGGAPRRGGTW